MTCRHCGQPIRHVWCSGRWVWVHDQGGYPCRDPDCWATLDTIAAPTPLPAPPVVGGDHAIGWAVVPR